MTGEGTAEKATVLGVGDSLIIDAWVRERQGGFKKTNTGIQEKRKSG